MRTSSAWTEKQVPFGAVTSMRSAVSRPWPTGSVFGDAPAWV
jgi:hypothetical protein